MASKNPAVAIERITPKQAREYLQANTDNYRRFRSKKVEQYARDMRSGEWDLTGEAIKFDKAGVLADGQNRLAACVSAGRPFKTLVIRGLEPSAVASMDTGANRSVSDHLKRNGHKNTTLLAAAARWCWAYEHAEIMTRKGASTHEVLAMVDTFPSIVESAQFIASRRLSFGGAHKIATCVHHYTRGLPGEHAAFYEQLRSGLGLEEVNPVFVLRRWLENNAIKARSATPIHTEAAYIKAWNAWIEGRQIKNLSHRMGGIGAEEFPRIVTEYPS